MSIISLAFFISDIISMLLILKLQLEWLTYFLLLSNEFHYHCVFSVSCISSPYILLLVLTITFMLVFFKH
jgi:hypothetical protein